MFPTRYTLHAIVRGVALGLWILTGLAFLVSALFPGSTGAAFLGPLLLTCAVFLTALAPRGAVLNRKNPTRRLLYMVGAALLVLAIALTIIRTGDQRSFLFALFITIAALALSLRQPHT
jgi:hypothetical protein